jgi:adenylate cyclase
MERLSRLLTSSIAVVVVAILFVVLKFYNLAPIQILQLKTFDWLITSLEPKKSDDIIIVEFGEKSVTKFGQWPFDRRDIAKVIQQLRDNGAGVIVAPILFSERDRAGGDDTLVQTLKQNGVVIAQTATTQTSKPDAARRGFAAIGGNPRDWAFTWRGAIPPLASMATVADGVGVIASVPERDGVARRLPMLVNIAGELYPSLVLETIRVAAGDPSYQIKVTDAGIEAVRIPKFNTIHTDANGRVWLSWNTSFDRIEATEIDRRVEGKIVVLGLSVEGVGGIIATPNGERWAHDLQAQALQTVIDGTSINRFAFADILEMLALVFLLLVLIVVVPRLSIAWTVPFFAAFIAAVVGGSYYSFQHSLQLWDPSYLTLSGCIVYGQIIFNNFVREFRLKQQIKKQFGTYLSPALVEKLQKDPSLLRLGGERRELSIMFTDVRGFTTISEHYGDNVEGLTAIMNRYMTAMTAKILENNGTLDKYIGDAQMAFWNAPLDDADHAHHAVKTALEMLNDLQAFNDAIAAEGVPAFGMGLGINTGDVVVGNMGSSQRFDYTCLGDAVNLASRLEGQSKPYHVKLVIGPKTAEYVKNSYHVVELDCLAVKGKKEGVNIFTILDNDNWQSIHAMSHKDFLELYRAGNWDQAISHANVLKKTKFGTELKDYYEAMIERIEEYKENPPKDWDGVFHATSK